ncbi:hypothetical protein [Halomonas sp.]|uniref:hypothetical protein n=1 Tax=Halomonas sp. TaxID=1486246 RepID=UPI00263771D6|nr:hypothetical protein [Halomonas sp.]
MHVDTPRHILHLAGMARLAGGNDAAFRLRLRRETALFHYELRDLEPGAEQVEDAAAFISAISGILVGEAEARALLTLYPEARIRLAAYRDTADVEVRETLAFCVAHFFLGCRWPSVHDRLDHGAFLSLLRDQAGLAGWRCAPPAAVDFLLDGSAGHETPSEESLPPSPTRR